MAVRDLVKVTPNVAAPTIVDHRPRGWRQLGAPTRTDWGVWRVFFDGTDVTEYGKPGKRTAVPTRWSYVKPHWFGEATVELATVSGYESEPSWLANGKEVRLRRETSPGVFSADVRDEWRGFVEAYGDGDQGGTRVAVRGLYQQPDLYRRAPTTEDQALDIGELWAFNLDTGSRPAYRWPSNPAEPVTGKTTRQRGQWETTLEYLTSIGAALPGWTWRPDADFTPRYVDTTVEAGDSFTVRYGAFGVAPENVDLRKELRASPNVIYAEGNINGTPWKLIVPIPGGVFHAPLSASKKVHTLFYDEPTGDLIEDTSEFDDAVLRIETFWKLPPGMTIDDAFALAEEFRTRVEDPGWAGRIRLDAWDLLDMRPDDTLTLQGYRGADPTFGIAGADFEWNKGAPTVDLTVDTNGRDLAMVTAILEGDWDRATNPFAGVQIGKLSGQREDRKAEWSDESGSGWGPNDATNGRRHKDGASTFPVTGGQWNEYVFLASEQDTIRFSRIVCSTDGSVGVGVGRRFVAIVTSQTVPLPPDPDSPLPVDPMADGVWEQIDDALAFQFGWGGSFRDPATGLYVPNAAGYGNVAWNLESLGDDVTGLMLDTGTAWDYTHEDPEMSPGAPRLVLYIFPIDAGSFECWFQFAKGPLT